MTGDTERNELTPEELSARTGEPLEGLRRWQELGLIGAGGGLEPMDAERVRLLQMLLRRGIGLEAIAAAARELGLEFAGYLSVLFPEGSGRAYQLSEAAEITGLSADFVQRLLAMLWPGESHEWLSEEDLELLRALKTGLDVGLPENALLEVLKVYADALARVAEAETRLVSFHTMRPRRDAGLAGRAFAQAYTEAAARLYPLTDPILRYFHSKGLTQAAREDIVMNLAEEAGLLGKPDAPGQIRAAFAFVDLSSFTPLAEAMGDQKAAEVLERFSSLVRECVARRDGRVVKQIGDAFMLVFPDARSAVACALEIEARASAEPQFPAARVGIHWGQVLYREGDYVGSNVNIAARVAAEAERHQVLVTAAVREEAKGLPDIEFVPLGKRRLKGLTSELVLFEARPPGTAGRDKHVDPVCRMEMTPDEVAARLTLEGTEHCFCSDECLRRYVVAPERYST